MQRIIAEIIIKNKFNLIKNKVFTKLVSHTQVVT